MRAEILTPTPRNLAIAAEAIRNGEVVGMPTETVYGLAGAAHMPDALARIFATKERPTFDPLIVHVGIGAKGTYALEHLKLIDGKALSEAARTRADALINAFWPGPLTLVLPKHESVPELATSGLPTVALRMPAHRVAQWLIASAGVPLAAPSANRFGRISPTSAQAVAEELGDRIDWILDGGDCEIGVESTVLRVESDGAVTMLRPGGLPRARIEEVIGVSVSIASSTSQPGAAQPGASPGLLESHYAPAKPLHLLPKAITAMLPEQWELVARRAQADHATRIGALLRQCADLAQAKDLIVQKLSASGLQPSSVTILTLSRDGDAHDAARRLFASLRELDASEAQVLFAEPCPTAQGLDHAIMDRLARAASK
jgi:L-threonylcarbamoyladenylate synthase